MGTEKGLLVYHQLPQQYHACHLLEPFCKMVYLGCNPVQAEAANPAYAVLPDHPDYAGLGPLTAVLSFRRAWPGGHLLGYAW